MEMSKNPTKMGTRWKNIGQVHLHPYSIYLLHGSIYIYILYSTQAWFLNSDLNTFVDISGYLDGESSCEKEAGNW